MLEFALRSDRMGSVRANVVAPLPCLRVSSQGAPAEPLDRFHYR